MRSTGSPGPEAPRPRALLRSGETAVLAEYADTAEVLAVAAAVRALAPPHLLELVPAERTLLLAGATARDADELGELLQHISLVADAEEQAAELVLGVVYDGEDLAETAELLGMSTQALIEAHTQVMWTAAFGGFAPGFAYLLPDHDQGERPGAGPDGEKEGSSPVRPWSVPRRAEPRTSVPAGAVGLAADYCGIYPRSSPGGWQLIGRTEAELFDPSRSSPALLTPGTRVRFSAQRASARGSRTASAVDGAAEAITRVRRGAAAVPGMLTGHGGARETAPRGGSAALTVLTTGPLALIEDAGRPGGTAIGVSVSGAFDQGALVRANLAVGNPASAAGLEILAGPLHLRVTRPVVVALAGAACPVTVRRRDRDSADVDLPAGASSDVPVALDTGDLLEVGAAEHGLRTVLAVRGGIRTAHGPVLGSLSYDTFSELGPAPLSAGDELLVGPDHHLAAVTPPPPAPQQSDAPGPAAPPELEIVTGPRDRLLGDGALEALVGTSWTVRTDSDRTGVRLEGTPLAVPAGADSLPSEAMVPGAIQVPPSGLPVVFGPDHPTTGGYPVIAVVTRSGLDLLAQAAPGTTLRFTVSDRRGPAGG